MWEKRFRRLVAYYKISVVFHSGKTLFYLYINIYIYINIRVYINLFTKKGKEVFELLNVITSTYASRTFKFQYFILKFYNSFKRHILRTNVSKLKKIYLIGNIRRPLRLFRKNVIKR